MTEQSLDFTLNKVNVLIVYDNRVFATALQIQLEEFGIRNIKIALNLKEAIQLFSDNFSIIFTDYNSPSSNDIAFANYYRKVFPKKDTPIVLCGTVSDSKRRECIEAGIDDFLSKPSSSDSIQEILECWLPYKILKQENIKLDFKSS